jgi:hypothetical protein
MTRPNAQVLAEIGVSLWVCTDLNNLQKLNSGQILVQIHPGFTLKIVFQVRKKLWIWRIHKSKRTRRMTNQRSGQFITVESGRLKKQHINKRQKASVQNQQRHKKRRRKLKSQRISRRTQRCTEGANRINQFLGPVTSQFGIELISSSGSFQRKMWNFGEFL